MTRPAAGRGPARRARPGPRQRAAADPVAVGDLAARLRDVQRALRPRLVHAVRRSRTWSQSTHATLDPQRVARVSRRRGRRPGGRCPIWAVVTADVDGQLTVLAQPRATRARWPRRRRPSAGGWCTAARTSPAPTCATTRGCQARARRAVPPSASCCAAASRPSARWSASTGRASDGRAGAARRACAKPAACWEPAALALENALLLHARRGAVGDRRPHAALQFALPEPVAAARDQARGAHQPRAVAAVHRPRRVQGGQRHVRAPVWQPRAGRGGRRDSRQRARDRRRRALRRRRVRRGPAGDRRATAP